MNALFRCRVDRKILKQADRVAERLGTSTPEMVRIFVTQIARTGRVPLNLDPGAKSDDAITAPWSDRAKRLETFYDPAKTW